MSFMVYVKFLKGMNVCDSYIFESSLVVGCIEFLNMYILAKLAGASLQRHKTPPMSVLYMTLNNLKILVCGFTLKSSNKFSYYTVSDHPNTIYGIVLLNLIRKVWIIRTVPFYNYITITFYIYYETHMSTVEPLGKYKYRKH